VKLLFDGNLSHHLVDNLSDFFPQSTHIRNIGLAKAPDEAVWQYAKENDFIIVSKDADMLELSIILGPPPKLIWIRRGNCSTSAIHEMIRSKVDEINSFHGDKDNSCLILR
jgi:predicted nuclease of predicted toxin-antitoxin system